MSDKVIVAGSRDIMLEFTQEEAKELVYHIINSSQFEIGEIVSGGANGVDSIAEEYASEHNIELNVFEPDWDKFGDFAGPRRNKKMAKYAEKAIIVRVNNSAGSTSMLNIAEKVLGEDNVLLFDINTPN